MTFASRINARALATAVSVAASGLILAPPAAASIRAAVSVRTNPGTRLVVKLTSTRALSAKQRPTGVSVKAGSTTFKLSRASGASAAAVGLGTWSTRTLTGAAAAKALSLRGKPVTVVVALRRGSVTLRSTAASAGGIGGTTGGTPGGTTGGTPGGTTGGTPGGTTGGTPSGTGTPLFNPPGQELSGQAAYASFKQYFLNSEFSDCQAGHWPSCAVENRYEHGSDGTFEYRRCTPTSGSDINFVDSYTVTGAAQHADGSWVVEYTDQNGVGFYHWEVATDGTVNGYYVYNGGSPESLTGYFWRQPADLGDCYS